MPIERWGRGSLDGNIHHKDNDPSNNEPENLEVLHAACHTAHHLRHDSARQSVAGRARWSKPEWAAQKAARQAERDRIASRTREEMIAARNEAIRAGHARSTKSPGRPGVPKPEGFGAKVSARLAGVPKTAEHRAAMSRARRALNDEQRAEVRRRVHEGETQASVAKAFGVSPAIIWRAVHADASPE